jgi:tetratricopeptide (TPR) repeat protein
LWFWLREPEKSLAVLNSTPLDYLSDVWVRGTTKGLLTGAAHQLAGRHDAAVAEWRSALQVLDRRLSAQSNDINLLRERATLLALTGDRVEAERLMRLCDQMASQPDSTDVHGFDATLLMLLDRRDESITHIEAAFARINAYSRAELRYSPVWDPLRNHPRFAALVKETESKK